MFKNKIDHRYAGLIILKIFVLCDWEHQEVQCEDERQKLCEWIDLKHIF